MGDPDMGDFRPGGFGDFGDDGGGFRGRGGNPWRPRGGGRGGHGGFDNGFGPPRGPPPRFRGRGGFGSPGGNMMRGPPPGPRGSPGNQGFRGGFERPPFRFSPGGGGGGGGWNGPPPFHMGPGGNMTDSSNDSPVGGFSHGRSPPDSQSQDIWAETKSDNGASYYYNTKTRVTSWERPEGPNVTIMSHEEYSAIMKEKGEKGPGVDGAANQPGPAVSNGATASPEVNRPANLPPVGSVPMGGVPPIVTQSGGPPAGFPPFGSPPPFGLQFPMVPPPWTAPAPIIPIVDPMLLQHMDPSIVAKALEWTEHISPGGKPYYFHAKTQTSVWDKPTQLLEFEAAKIIAQQRMSQAALNASKEKDKHDRGEMSKERETETKKGAVSSADKGKPISSTPVSGTPWCVVWTGDKRVFFYNPSTKSSVWERPPELIGRLDVEELLRTCPKPTVSSTPVKKAEATSTSESQRNDSLKSAPGTSPPPPNTDAETKTAAKRTLEEKDEIEEPTEKKTKNDPDATDNNDPEVITIDDSKDEQRDVLKEASSIEFEAKAARERATVPLETRLQQFKEMLAEKQVSAFSTWEKELHKIVFDQRYLLLTSKERKAAFDDYVKDRACEERKEKKARLIQIKESFFKFLEDVRVHQKMSYNEFSQKYSRDERFRSVERTRDRETYFQEYIAELKKKEKENRKVEKEKAKEKFLHALKDGITDYHIRWEDVKKQFESPKFEILEPEEKEELFRKFQKRLKVEIKMKEKEKKKKKSKKTKKEKKEKEIIEGQPNEGAEEGETPESEKSDAEDGAQDEGEDNGEVNSDEEEGIITDDSEDEERIKKEKAEISIREREKEVQRVLATHLRDRDKERDYYKHEESVQEFQAMMTDIVKMSEMSWKEAKKSLKKDRRWELVTGTLSRDEMEELFNNHRDNIEKKKRLRFRELLKEARVKLNSSWKEIRRKIRDDPRYQKFTHDERKCEREFSAYLKDLASSMKSDFRALLKETKMLNYKTKQTIRENHQVLENIEAVLEKDKRFLNLETMPEERNRLLFEYLEELERIGPPPPPTASDKAGRRLK